MQINIESPHIRVSQRLNEFVHRKFENLVKLSSRINRCNVILRKEKNDTQKNFLVSANMNLPNTVICGEDRAESFEIAIDKVVRELQSQLHRHKQKLEEKR